MYLPYSLPAFSVGFVKLSKSNQTQHVQRDDFDSPVNITLDYNISARSGIDFNFTRVINGSVFEVQNFTFDLKYYLAGHDDGTTAEGAYLMKPAQNSRFLLNYSSVYANST